MALLTMTPLVVEALGERAADARSNTPATEGEPSLDSPAAGNPISHRQLVDLSKDLHQLRATTYSLENLLKGSTVYFPPPPPKPEPVSVTRPLFLYSPSSCKY